MQQSATGAPAVTANATIAGNNVKPQSSMDHTNISRANNAMKDVDGMHFTSSQQATVTTTAAPVITVVAPSTQSTGWSPRVCRSLVLTVRSVCFPFVCKLQCRFVIPFVYAIT